MATMRPMMVGMTVFLAAGTAGAASFPCADARKPVERLICSAPELSRADERMGDAYADLLKAVAGQGADGALRDRLRTAQRNWIAWRDRTCEVPAGNVTPGDLAGLSDCLHAVTLDRVEDLRRLREGLPVSALVEPQPIQESNAAKRYELDVLYPAIDASVPGATGFNALVEGRIRRQVDAFRAEAAAAEPVEDFRAGLTISYDLAYVSPRMVSVAFQTYDFPAGAAHGMTIYEGLHYDLAAGRAFGADAVFRTDSGWQAALAGHALAELRRQARADDFELFAESEAAVADIVADLANWRLEADMAYIVFDPYVVAAYAAGPREVPVSYPLLAPFLRPDGPLPPKR